MRSKNDFSTFGRKCSGFAMVAGSNSLDQEEKPKIAAISQAQTATRESEKKSVIKDCQRIASEISSMIGKQAD